MATGRIKTELVRTVPSCLNVALLAEGSMSTGNMLPLERKIRLNVALLAEGSMSVTLAIAGTL